MSERKIPAEHLEILRPFVEGAKKAGLSQKARRAIFERQQSATRGSDPIMEGDKLPHLTAATTEKVLQVLAEKEILPKSAAKENEKTLSVIARTLYDFGDTQFKPDHPRLEKKDITQLTILASYLEHFLYSGKCVELTQQDNETTTALLFVINRLAKIYNNPAYKGIFKDFDPKKLRTVIEYVKQQKETPALKASIEQMEKRIQAAEKNERNTVGLYLLKDIMIAASASTKKGQNFEIAATYKHGKASYDFSTKTFKEDERFFATGGKRSVVHYDPRDIVFAAAAVDYFSTQKK